mgnify:FL=1
MGLLHVKLFLSFSQSEFVTAQGVGRRSNILNYPNYACMEAVEGRVLIFLLYFVWHDLFVIYKDIFVTPHTVLL